MDSFWIREVEIIAGGKRFNSNDLDMEFIVPFENNSEPDVARVTLFNLSDNSINAIKTDQNVIINAGYRGDIGTIFMGTIQSAVTRWREVDKITELKIGDGASQWLTKEVSRAYAEGTAAKEILEDLTGMFGLELGRLDLVNDLTYPKGRVIDSMLKDAVKQIVEETGSEFIISKGRIYIMPHEEGIPTGFLLTSDTGLLGSPEAFEKEERRQTLKGYKVRMLLNHRITINSIFMVQSRTANGTFRALKGRHYCGIGNDYFTEVEALE